ncbi:MAG: hypothetical protein ABWY51_03340 [Gaiellaceae bacterium]
MKRLRGEHVAVAAGLLSAAVVAVTLLTRDDDEQPPTTTHAAQPPPPPPSALPRHRAAVRDGRVVVDGKPFFPIMSWGECTDGFETSLPVGTNLYAGNRCGGLEAQLPALGDRALSAAVQGEPVPDAESVIGVFYPDEPDGQGLTAKTMATIDPEAGVRFLTLTNHFYSGAAPLAQGRGVYPGLIAKADMIGFDLYPLQSWCRPERLVDVYHSQRELVDLAQGKPTFQWIEAAGMTCPHGGVTAITPQTVRAESWLAIAGGAKGLGFFPPAAWTGDVGEAIAGVTETVRQLGPALTSPEVAARVEPADGLVRAGARKRGGGLTIVAANAGYEPADATITVPGLAGRALNVVGTGRHIEPDGDTFADRFPSLGSRVYVTGG